MLQAIQLAVRILSSAAPVSARGEPGPPKDVPEREVAIASGIFSTVFELVARVVPGLLYPNSDSSTVLVLEMHLYVDRAMRGAWEWGDEDARIRFGSAHERGGNDA